jgi:hypothetical protein
VFETVVRAEVQSSVADSATPHAFLRVDSRPAGDTAVLAGNAERAKALDPNEAGDPLSSRGLDRIIDQRKGILKLLHVEEGGAFFYPDCGGIRPRWLNDSIASVGTKCPSEWHRYVTVGLPYRGAAPILAKLRRAEIPPPDSVGEVWTVLVTESSIGPGGQDLRQYAWLLKRDAETGRLAVVERILLSWAE